MCLLFFFFFVQFVIRLILGVFSLFSQLNNLQIKINKTGKITQKIIYI